MPPAFVLSQDQTLHKNYFNNSRCQIFFKKNRFSSISLCNLNYIQIQCKLSGYIALFNFQTTAATQRPALSSAPLNSEPFCGVLFNITQVCVLSNFIFNFFFKLFYFSSALIRSANRGMRFNISQFWNLSNLFSNFFESFLSALSLNASCVLRHEV